MTAPIIQADYDQLKQIAGCFKRKAQSNDEMHRSIQSRVEPLQNGGWLGRGSEAFSIEMEGDIYPALERLTSSLSEASVVVIDIIDLLQNAEEDAASPFGGGRWELPDGGAPADGVGSILPIGPPSTEVTLPPPRIYIVNGINSTGNVIGATDANGNPINADDQSVALEQLLEAYGYDPAQVTSTQAIYIAPQGTDLTGTDLQGTDLEGTDLEGTNLGGWWSPVDWVTGAGASAIDGITGAGVDAIDGITGAGANAIDGITGAGAWAVNSATGALIENSVVGSGYGSYEVALEHFQGADGQYSQQIYAEIVADLAANPLAPGQTIVLMGHSGGGAVTANLSGMLEGANYDVTGMVTMGSPLSNYSDAAQYADLVVDIRHEGDEVVNPLSNPFENWNPVDISRYGIPGWGDPTNVAEVTLSGPYEDGTMAHNTYMHEPAISASMLEHLNQLFPDMNLQLPPTQ